MTSNLRLSVLDQAVIPTGGSLRQVVENTVQLAQATEAMGYHRYWVAEHHFTSVFASCAPELLVSMIAAATKTIRVGSGGVLLRHYSPFKVAETFQWLNACYPNRIDLGIGRSTGSNDPTADALAYHKTVNDEGFLEKLKQLKSWASDESVASEDVPAADKAKTVSTSFGAGGDLPVWLLGSSESSAKVAAQDRLNYTFAHFINPHVSEQAMATFHGNHFSDAEKTSSHAALAIVAYCADTEEEAEALGYCRKIWALNAFKGNIMRWPSIEEAANHPLTEQDKVIIAGFSDYVITGTPQKLQARFLDLAECHGVDELIILSNCHNSAHRQRSFQLLADTLL